MLETWRIRKGDRVVVISGKDKNKVGEILKVFRKKDKVLVKEVNIITKHQRQTATSTGGLLKKEAPIHVSNVMLADPRDDHPTRIGMKIIDGKKTRYAKRSGEIIDNKG